MGSWIRGVDAIRLEVSGLRIAGGDRPWAKSLSFECRTGQLTAVFGPSGSGKSALLLTVAGRMRPQEGHVWIIDPREDDELRRPVTAADVGFGGIGRFAPLFDTLTVRDQLLLHARLLRVPHARHRVDELLREFDLDAVRARRTKELDAFAAACTNAAVACVHRPPFVLLDQPDAGLTADEWTAMMALLRRIAAGGSGVLYTTVSDLATQAADAVVRIPAGEVVGA
jgi:ABC-type multidrug transport system ATPase subunit